MSVQVNGCKDEVCEWGFEEGQERDMIARRGVVGLVVEDEAGVLRGEGGHGGGWAGWWR